MSNNTHSQGAPLDIVDIPERPAAPRRAKASHGVQRTAPSQKTASAPAKHGAAKKPARAEAPVKSGRHGGGKGPVKKKKAKGAAPRGDELPLWLEKIVDWFMDLPERLKTLPGRFVKLFDSWFYRIYFPAVALALIAIAIGLHLLTGYAADYEASQPAHVADDVARLFTEGHFDQLYNIDTSAQELSGGDPAFYAQSLSQLAAGKSMDYASAYSADKDVLNYNVTLDGAKFASFTLVPSGQTTRHGNTLWQLGSVATNVVLESTVAAQDPSMASCRIQVLPEYTVSVDGNPLADADVIRRDIPVFPDGFLPSGVNAPTLVEYGFNSESPTPQISVTAPDGTALTPVEASESIWVCGLKEDEAMKSQYSEAIVKMAQRIAKYTTQDVSQDTALSSVLSDSPAENIIRKFSNRWAPSHKEESFQNMEVSEFYVLSDNCLTCHVKFDYILTSRRENDYTYPTEYTFCIVRKNGEGKLYNVVFH